MIVTLFYLVEDDMSTCRESQWRMGRTFVLELIVGLGKERSQVLVTPWQTAATAGYRPILLPT